MLLQRYAVRRGTVTAVPKAESTKKTEKRPSQRAKKGK